VRNCWLARRVLNMDVPAVPTVIVSDEGGEPIAAPNGQQVELHLRFGAVARVRDAQNGVRLH